MKKRCASERLIHPNSSPINGKYKSFKEVRLAQEKETVALQLSDLQQRIELSKPLLQNIYGKMHKKQQVYQQNLKRQIQRGEETHELTKEYKRLHADAVRIMARNNFGAEAGALSNYRTRSIQELSIARPVQAQGRNSQLGHCQSAANISKENIRNTENYQRILDSHRRPMFAKEPVGSEHPVSAKNIYERYRSKISEAQVEESTLNRVRRLSKEIDRDLQELKLNKNSSINNLKPSKYTALTLNQPPKDRKTYFLQLQKRKLKKV